MVTRGDRSFSQPLPSDEPRHLLVVEAHHLLRWSLSTYFSTWFIVHAESDVAAAERILQEGRRIDALVVSDDLPSSSVEHLQTLARAKNPGVIVVQTVSDSPTVRSSDIKATQLEKPFDLNRLADLLGVSSPPVSGTPKSGVSRKHPEP